MRAPASSWADSQRSYLLTAQHVLGSSEVQQSKMLTGRSITARLTDIKRANRRTPDQSNVITCASTRAINIAKSIAALLLEAGVNIRGIAPQIDPIENKVTIEFYHQ